MPGTPMSDSIQNGLIILLNPENVETTLPRPVSSIDNEWLSSPLEQDRNNPVQAMIDESSPVRNRATPRVTPKSRRRTDPWGVVLAKHIRLSRNQFAQPTTNSYVATYRSETPAKRSKTDTIGPTPVESTSIDELWQLASSAGHRGVAASLATAAAARRSNYQESSTQRQLMRPPKQEHDQQENIATVIEIAPSKKTGQSKAKEPLPAVADISGSDENVSVMEVPSGRRTKSSEDVVNRVVEDTIGFGFEPNYTDELKLFLMTAMTVWNELRLTKSRKSSLSTYHSDPNVLMYSSSSSTRQSESASPSNKSTSPSAEKEKALPVSLQQREMHPMTTHLNTVGFCEGDRDTQIGPWPPLTTTLGFVAGGGVAAVTEPYQGNGGDKSLFDSGDRVLVKVNNRSITTSRTNIDDREQWGVGAITLSGVSDDGPVVAQSKTDSEVGADVDLSLSRDIAESHNTTAGCLRQSESSALESPRVSYRTEHRFSLNDEGPPRMSYRTGHRFSLSNEGSFMKPTAISISRPNEDDGVDVVVNDDDDDCYMMSKQFQRVARVLDVTHRSSSHQISSSCLAGDRFRTRAVGFKDTSAAQTHQPNGGYELFPAQSLPMLSLSSMDSSKGSLYSDVDFGNRADTMDNKQLFSGLNNNVWTCPSPPILATTTVVTADPIFMTSSDRHPCEIRSVSTLSCCSTNTNRATPGVESSSCSEEQQQQQQQRQQLYHSNSGINPLMLLTDTASPVLIPLTTVDCPCGFPAAFVRSVCTMTQSGSHLLPVDPRHGIYHESCVLPFRSELEDEPSTFSPSVPSYIGLRSSRVNLEASQMALDLSQSSRAPEENGCLASSYRRTKSGTVTWRLIVINKSLRRRKVEHDNPAPPSRSQAYVSTDFKPDVALLTSHATANSHVVVYPGNMNRKCETTIDDSTCDTKPELFIDSTTSTQLEYDFSYVID